MPTLHIRQKSLVPFAKGGGKAKLLRVALPGVAEQGSFLEIDFHMLRAHIQPDAPRG